MTIICTNMSEGGIDDMKKLFAILLSLILVLSLASCAGRAPREAMYDDADYVRESPSYNGAGWYDEGYAYPEEEATSSSEYGSESVTVKGRKLIKTYDIDIQTLEFDQLIADIESKVRELGGYVENSSVSGNSINYKSNRYASYTVRIPSAKSQEFIDFVGNSATVTNKNENVNDITLGYVDTESRIASLQTEYDRLLELLAEAENVDTIITLESRLSEVRYELESYKSQLRTYDNLVDYSTIDLGISEVERVSAIEEKTVFDRIAQGFGDNLYDVTEALKDFFVWFVSGIPVFILLAVIILIIVLIIKFIFRNTPRNKAKRAAKKAAKEAAKLAKENQAKAESEKTAEPSPAEENKTE